MYTIEVDFEVYKQLTNRRENEHVTYNDVVRDLLGIKTAVEPPANQVSHEPGGEWVTKGVNFPAGTEFRVGYKGKTYLAKVQAGALALEGKLYHSPSAAAMSITKSAVNGWRFWECRMPGRSNWQLIESLRR